MPPRKVAEYYMQMNEVAYDLIEILQKQRDSAGIYHNVTDLSFRWGFECELIDIHFIGATLSGHTPLVTDVIRLTLC